MDNDNGTVIYPAARITFKESHGNDAREEKVFVARDRDEVIRSVNQFISTFDSEHLDAFEIESLEIKYGRVQWFR